jgi:hypothetical protein
MRAWRVRPPCVCGPADRSMGRVHALAYGPPRPPSLGLCTPIPFLRAACLGAPTPPPFLCPPQGPTRGAALQPARAPRPCALAGCYIQTCSNTLILCARSRLWLARPGLVARHMQTPALVKSHTNTSWRERPRPSAPLPLGSSQGAMGGHPEAVTLVAPASGCPPLLWSGPTRTSLLALTLTAGLWHCLPPPRPAAGALGACCGALARDPAPPPRGRCAAMGHPPWAAQGHCNHCCAPQPLGYPRKAYGMVGRRLARKGQEGGWLALWERPTSMQKRGRVLGG